MQSTHGAESKPRRNAAVPLGLAPRRASHKCIPSPALTEHLPRAGERSARSSDGENHPDTALRIPRGIFPKLPQSAAWPNSAGGPAGPALHPGPLPPLPGKRGAGPAGAARHSPWVPAPRPPTARQAVHPRKGRGCSVRPGAGPRLLRPCCLLRRRLQRRPGARPGREGAAGPGPAEIPSRRRTLRLTRSPSPADSPDWQRPRPMRDANCAGPAAADQ